MEPFDILKEAIKKVPAMRYALAVAALVAVVAIIASFQLDPKVAVIGSVLVLGAMVVIAVFAKLTSTAKKHFLKPVLVMMWAFLVLVIAMATLLLTAVAFRWPPGLAEWLFPVEARTGDGTKPTVAKPEIPAAQLSAIKMQADAGDYSAAWNAITEALKSAPESDEGLRLQAQIAMGWLRFRFGFEETALVDKLSPCLYVAATGSDRQFAADACAHIGWGNYLKTRAGSNIDPVAQFRKSLELDPDNTYAHAMWGYVILWGDLDRYKEGSDHFASALKSGRDTTYVRWLQISTLASQRFDSQALDLIRIADEMRRNGETAGVSLCDKILWHVYQGNWREVLADINSTSPVLAPSDHLATIEWLANDGKPLNPHAQFFVARLKEQMGDRPAALAIYLKMQSVENPGIAYIQLESEIKQGVARCQM